jgi:MFS family permease
MGASICCADAEADTQFTIFDLSALKKQCLIFSMVMVADLADPNQSGLTMGLRFTAIMLAGLLSPVLLGLIIESFGMRPAFYVAAVVVVLTGIRMFIIRPDLIPGRRR